MLIASIRGEPFDRPRANETLNRRACRRSRRARGFSIPTAIFVIVILAALGAFLVTIGSGQQIGLAQDVVGIRAMQAARSGLDWGVHQTIVAGSNFRGNCTPGGTSATLPVLNGITVVVSCSSAAYTEGATPLRSYQIVATACNNPTCPNTVSPNGMYVERRLSALVVN